MLDFPFLIRVFSGASYGCVSLLLVLHGVRGVMEIGEKAASQASSHSHGLAFDYPSDEMLSPSPNCQCDALTADNGTCLIYKSHHWNQPGHFTLECDGNIHFTNGTQVTKDKGNLLIQANGWVHMDGAAMLHVQGGDLHVTAKAVSLWNRSAASAAGSVTVISTETDVQITSNANVSADVNVSLLGDGVNLWNGAQISAGQHLTLGGIKTAGDFEDTCLSDILLEFATVRGLSIDFRCGASDIQIRNSAVVSTPNPAGWVHINGRYVDLGEGSLIETMSLFLHASGDANVTGDLPGIPQWDGAPPGLDPRDSPQPVLVAQRFSSVNISVFGHLNLGHNSDTGSVKWAVQWLQAVAGSIVVDPGLLIQTNASSCYNQRTTFHDVCIDVLNNGWVDSDANVTYDFLLAAQGTLEILPSTKIEAASMMICAGGAATFGDGAALDTSGRGCGPGIGRGHGETRESYVGCGAGGGSHIGKGGQGAQYGRDHVSLCAEGGRVNDPEVPGMLPTLGASGGGCGVPPPCNGDNWKILHTNENPSAGGGLLWLSAPEFVFHGTVKIAADGNTGISVPYMTPPLPAEMVSGGGSGGQIVLFTTKFSYASAEVVHIHAKGGSGDCTLTQVSGGGGGGFVGLTWNGGAIDPDIESTMRVDIAGGVLNERCASHLPRLDEADQSIQSSLNGKSGLAAPLEPCGPGLSGLFCNPCPIGRYKGREDTECVACTGKPETNANYAGPTGWPNSTCPYRCVPSVPNVKSNPKCLDAFQYTLHFYGGVAGLLCVLAVLILVIMFLLCRRTNFSKRVFSRLNTNTGSFTAETAPAQSESGRCRRLLKKLRRCFRRSEQTQKRRTVQFTREQLPFHICRVYLNGQNTSSRPWVVEDKVPTIVEHLVTASVWEQFACESSSLAKVPTSEVYFEQLLKVLYPAALAAYKYWRRHQRAKKLRKCANTISEGSDEAALFWRLIRASGMSQLVMAFGCDPGATLGYLDFFDFSRSQFDWAPVDLRREVRLLIAHGLGSSAEPFQLDTGDPIVYDLAENCFSTNSSSVFSVISTFNRISRLMPASELDSSDTTGLIYQGLSEKVIQCAAKCGLAGCVQVLLVPQVSAASQEKPQSNSIPAPRDSQTSFSDLIRNPPPESPTGGAGPSAAAGHNFISWEGLQPLHTVMEQGASTMTTTTSATPSRRHKLAMRLCLAFIDSAAAQDSVRSGSSTAGGSCDAPQPLGTALTSPMPHTALAEHLAWLPQCQAESAARPKVTSWISSCRYRWYYCLLSLRFSTWNSRAAALARAATPPTVLLLFVLLYFADLMVFMLMGSIYLRLGSGIIALWILVPPLTQPLAIVTGAIFAFSERPRLGRFFASLIAFSAVNVITVTIAVISFFNESWFFHTLELPIAFVVKAMLFMVVTVHIGNLEAAHDLSFMDTPQADFLGVILATDWRGDLRSHNVSMSPESSREVRPLGVLPESPRGSITREISKQLSPDRPMPAASQAGNVDASPSLETRPLTSPNTGYTPSPF